MRSNIGFALFSLTFLVLIFLCDSARILAVIPLFAKSHHYVIQSIIKELVARGHDVTFITPIRTGINSTNLKEIEIHTFLEKLLDTFDFDVLRKLGQVPYINLIEFWSMGTQITEDTLKHPEVQKIIHSNEKYDLVLLETHFAQEALIAFGHRFNAPVISLATFSSYTFMDEFIGNPYGTAYIPGFELPYTSEMTFFQRAHNVLRVISVNLAGYFFYLPYHDSIMRKYFNHTGSESIPSLVNMLEDIALVIVNSQIAVDYPKPWVPNCIGVAGLHIAPNTKQLPNDLKDFMDESKNGVIYVSFGSVVPSEKMPEDMRQAFMKAFSKLKQNVLWKLPVDVPPPGISSNVKISKWLPQQDVLAHPNCLAFITHGGLLSQQEAVYYGVPLIGVPFFGDQYMNVERAAASGFAIPLDQYNITEKSLTWAINEVINNPLYRQKMKLQSKIFRDNPEPPIKKAMYWIDYVLRYKGAPHLRSHGRKLPWYKYLLLDVVVFLSLVLFTILFIIYFLSKSTFSLLCGSKKSAPQVKSTKKKN